MHHLYCERMQCTGLAPFSLSLGSPFCLVRRGRFTCACAGPSEACHQVRSEGRRRPCASPSPTSAHHASQRHQPLAETARATMRWHATMAQSTPHTSTSTPACQRHQPSAYRPGRPCAGMPPCATSTPAPPQPRGDHALACHHVPPVPRQRAASATCVHTKTLTCRISADGQFCFTANTFVCGSSAGSR